MKQIFRISILELVITFCVARVEEDYGVICGVEVKETDPWAGMNHYGGNNHMCECMQKMTLTCSREFLDSLVGSPELPGKCCKKLVSMGSHCVDTLAGKLGSQTPRYASVAMLTSIEINQNLYNRAGQATYSDPMQLWDKTTGNITDFNTHLTFIKLIQGLSFEGQPYADGIVFFMAPFGSGIPDDTAWDGLGLAEKTEILNSTSNPFIAVEFDTYINDWDPRKDHVGTDVNSRKSVANTALFCSIFDGRTNDAWISYNSTTKKGVASFLLWKKKKLEDANDLELENGRGAIRFSFEDSIRATNGFADKPGQGGFGEVCKGLASALFYLHEECDQCVLHRVIKSINVMFDANFEAKLGDFGLARLVDHDKGSQTTVPAGTMGYMPPGSVIAAKASKGSDIYSFGIVALELACGRKPSVPTSKLSRVVIVDWVWELYNGGSLLEAAAPKLFGEYDEVQIEEMLRTVDLWCVHPQSDCGGDLIRKVTQVPNFEA
ncbi:Prolamin-like domain [Dillenia turbinata]|uniref:non-specific serine/threonine protein kinase n=1 Tax=Dillenia turbinata TaxID=194707 RepID=A0AAN8ZLD4_9MAGN